MTTPTVSFHSFRDAQKAKEIRLADLAKHDSEEDGYVSIHRKVYDVTKFVAIHPGGKKTIGKLLGRDATADYEKQHIEAKKGLELLQKYFIGNLSDALDFDFDACCMESLPVYPIFHKFLTRIRSQESLDCVSLIRRFKKSLLPEVAEEVISKFIEPNAPSEVNIDHMFREELITKVNKDNISKTMFNGLEDLLLFQMKTGVYDLFIKSTEFKQWISPSYQVDLMQQMDAFLMDFGSDNMQVVEERGCFVSCFN